MFPGRSGSIRDVGRTIRPIAPTDTKPAAAMLARAFLGDPLYAWIIPDERERARRLPRLFAAELRAARRGHDKTDLAVDAGKILGGALWSPPDAPHPGIRQQLTALTAFPLILGTRMPVAIRSFTTVGLARPSRPHWYLSCVGVDPSAQRTGVARSLLTPRLARCDEDGIAAALATSGQANVAYYERLGFAVTTEIIIPGGGPAHWAMLRKPRR